MPLMDEFSKRGSTSRGGTGASQMWRHEVRPRNIGEFAVIRFISPFGNPKSGDTPKNILADESYYMYHAGQHASGKRFTDYVYCGDLNQDSSGHVIEPSKCRCQLLGYDEPPCYVDGKPSRNSNGTPDGFNSAVKQRYHYWVLHYYSFHHAQNPVVDESSSDYNAPWAVSRRDSGEVDVWDEVTVGSRKFFRETVMMPHLLKMARPTRESLRTHADRYGDITTKVYEFHKQQDSSGRGFINYQVFPSDIDVPKLGKERVQDAIKDLPRLDRIASEQIQGLDLVSFTIEDKEAHQEAMNKIVDSLPDVSEEVPKAGVDVEVPPSEEAAVEDSDDTEDPFGTMGNTDLDSLDDDF